MATLEIETHLLTPLQVAMIAFQHHKEGGEMHLCDGVLTCEYALVPSAILTSLHAKAVEWRNPAGITEEELRGLFESEKE